MKYLTLLLAAVINVVGKITIIASGILLAALILTMSGCGTEIIEDLL